ncbi:tetratricopeptide repeat domain 39A [Rhizopus azygosporus]|uniref:Tetratricopeptide repeat domain 39A n=1 Tax=Rhizopus azygosporus TaxID=86630 RepID=A0A367JPP0_RHIAZ|nr:tetratricopeptide repeat domain 39A [Rhizopus azygosporus]
MVAVLELKDTVEERCIDPMSTEHIKDNEGPLELEQIVNVLQSILIVQQQNKDEKARKMTTTTQMNNQSEQYYTSKKLKREEQVIVDYELDRHISHSHLLVNHGSSNEANLITLGCVDTKSIQANTLTPREQEKADEPIQKAVFCLFNNQFMNAKRLFEQQANSDPLHALGLGSMMFLKAVITLDHQVHQDAIYVLTKVYQIATAQIDKATRRHIGSTVSQYLSSCRQYIRLSKAVPTDIKPVKPKQLEMHRVEPISNGILRAHVVKAEACLQIAILYLLQETVTGYVKCGLNLRRAYVSYSIVWEEYKRMGQLHNEYIDGGTISGIQFGIGAIHLILSSLPQKVLRVISAFGWKPDKHLGFVLLKLCLEERRVRSPMASVMLLAYYTTLTSLCPQLLAGEYTQPAIETLLDAQRIYPNSCIFLYFAGRTSRLARNLILSSQSFLYASEISKNEWAEVEMRHVCSYEIALNHMMHSHWKEANDIFSTLYNDKYFSPALFRYLSAACLDMMGERTEAILALADVPSLISDKPSATEQYILRKVRFLQSSGYQDMDMILCALEYLYFMNAFEFMGIHELEHNLELVDDALSGILEAEKLEYTIRTRELLPETPPPQYEDQRGVLLLLKVAILNAMNCHQESIIHLNWVIDQRHKINAEKWIVPYIFWEAGVTAWNMEQRPQGVSFWQTALKYTNYDFENRLVMKINLAMTHAEEVGVSPIELKKQCKLNSSIMCTGNILNDSGIIMYQSSESTTDCEDEGNESIDKAVDRSSFGSC